MSKPRVRFPIGISDFRKVREGGYHYVDKTALIDAVIEEDAEVVLLPRPRRFGKTFTEPEVRAMVDAVGQPALIDRLRAFYNGYAFGGVAMYNPWSVLNYLRRGAPADQGAGLCRRAQGPRRESDPRDGGGVRRQARVCRGRRRRPARQAPPLSPTRRSSARRARRACRRSTRRRA